MRTMPKNSPGATIVLFDRDLRRDDHPALSAAAKRGGPVVPVFIWSPEDEGEWSPGAASRWWLHQSLESLQTLLNDLGSPLVIRSGRIVPTLRSLIRETGADAVYWNRRYEPLAKKRQEEWRDELRRDRVNVETFHDGLLFDPASILTSGGTPYQVFTPFWKQCLLRDEPGKPLAVPRRLIPPEKAVNSVRVKGLRLEPKIKWDAGLREAWTPGAAGAAAELKRFLQHGLALYAKERDRPDHLGTSRLSPHLHFGGISPRRVWHAVRRAAMRLPKIRSDVAEPFLRQLIWREFAAYLLYHFPHTPEEPLRPKFNEFPWRDDHLLLAAWQRGRTGYPIVDAGMRQLWETGWMHNRVRMIVGSFLVKDLLIPWQRGAEWFWDTLVDADLANNTMGWQWIAGCGADAAPFFRIFNPVSQGEKFDPQGEYIRRFVPELRELSIEWIHHPWDAPEEMLKSAGIKLGETYPRPLVNHAEARKEALAAFFEMQAGAGNSSCDNEPKA